MAKFNKLTLWMCTFLLALLPVTAQSWTNKIDTTKIIGTIAILFIFWLIFRVVGNFQNKRLLGYTGKEKKELKDTLLWKIGKKFMKDESTVSSVLDKAVKRESVDAQKEASEGQGGHGATRLPRDIARGTRDESKVERFTGALQGKALALDSALMDLVTTIKGIANGLDKANEKEDSVRGEMENDIQAIYRSETNPDRAIAHYIAQMAEKLSHELQGQIKGKKHTYHQLRKALLHLDESIKLSRDIEKEISDIDSIINKYETKSANDNSRRATELHKKINVQIGKIHVRLNAGKSFASRSERDGLERQLRILKAASERASNLHKKEFNSVYIITRGIKTINNIKGELVTAFRALKNIEGGNYQKETKKEITRALKAFNTSFKHLRKPLLSAEEADPKIVRDALIALIKNYTEEQIALLGKDTGLIKKLETVLKVGFKITGYYTQFNQTIKIMDKAETALIEANEETDKIAAAIEEKGGMVKTAEDIQKIRQILSKQAMVIAEGKKIDEISERYIGQIEGEIQSVMQDLLHLQEHEELLYAEFNRLQLRANKALEIAGQIAERKADDLQKSIR